MKIVVHIERLVLEGFPAGLNTGRVAEVSEQELLRLLFAVSPASWRGGVTDTFRAPGPALSAMDGAEAVGRGIARAAGLGIAAAHSANAQTRFARPDARP